MEVTAWILYIFFGLISLNGLFKFFFSRYGLGTFHAVIWMVSIIITALSAGVIWGGLLQ